MIIEIVAIPGGRITFQYGPDGGTGIGIMNSDGSSSTSLDCCGFRKHPAWAPDGSRIAYDAGGSFQGQNTTLHLIDPDGGIPVVTTLVGAEFAWNPSSTEVAFSRNIMPFELYTAVVSTSTATQLTMGVVDNFDPNWSPDGTKIVYESDKDIYLINADGTGAQLLTNLGNNGSPVWSPDGLRIAFESDRDGSKDIWIMDSDGSSPEQITSNDADDENPTWSPDGTWLAFASDKDAPGDFSIYVRWLGTRGGAYPPRSPELCRREPSVVRAVVAGSHRLRPARSTGPHMSREGRHRPFARSRDRPPSGDRAQTVPSGATARAP